MARDTRTENAPDTAARARLRRIGVIDVGSNSIRLVVFDGMARSPAYFFNEKVLCGLGAGLLETGRLSPDGWRRALAALRRFAALARRMDLSGLIAVATAAVRIAEDGTAFCDEVERQTGLQLHVTGGAEEARLSANGVLLGWPDAEGIVCDMGGSSMELASVCAGEVRDGATGPLGPLELADIADPGKRAKYVRKQVKALAQAVPEAPQRLFLVGGSWRAIARIDMTRVGYPLMVLNGYEPPIPQLLETLRWIPDQDAAALSATTGTSTARLSLVPLAAPVLAELIRRIRPERVAVSAYGLREGLLYRQMPEAVRRLDPLIEGCRHAESTSARVPGFGDALYAWLSPLFGDRPPETLRLVHAACLLHDVNWRAHPDFRAQFSFENVTRANVPGIGHAGRVFLGTALLNRYKSGQPSDLLPRLQPLLTAEQAAEAVTVGRAMRLGATLSGSSPFVLGHARLAVEDGRLNLTLDGPASACMGEPVERRLQSLATRLGLPAATVLR